MKTSLRDRYSHWPLASRWWNSEVIGLTRFPSNHPWQCSRQWQRSRSQEWEENLSHGFCFWTAFVFPLLSWPLLSSSWVVRLFLCLRWCTWTGHIPGNVGTPTVGDRIPSGTDSPKWGLSKVCDLRSLTFCAWDFWRNVFGDMFCGSHVNSTVPFFTKWVLGKGPRFWSS